MYCTCVGMCCPVFLFSTSAFSTSSHLLFGVVLDDQTISQRKIRTTCRPVPPNLEWPWHQFPSLNWPLVKWRHVLINLRAVMVHTTCAALMVWKAFSSLQAAQGLEMTAVAVLPHETTKDLPMNWSWVVSWLTLNLSVWGPMLAFWTRPHRIKINCLIGAFSQPKMRDVLICPSHLVRMAGRLGRFLFLWLTLEVHERPSITLASLPTGCSRLRCFQIFINPSWFEAESHVVLVLPFFGWPTLRGTVDDRRWNLACHPTGPWS